MWSSALRSLCAELRKASAFATGTISPRRRKPSLCEWFADGYSRARHVGSRVRAMAAEGMICAHFARSSRLRQGRFELGVNVRSFIFVINLVAAAFHAFVHAVGFSIAAIFFTAGPAQRQITNRCVTAVEMLVKPVFRRNDNAAFIPWKPLPRHPFGPHQRVTGAAENDDVITRTVPVSGDYPFSFSYAHQIDRSQPQRSKLSVRGTERNRPRNEEPEGV